MPRPEMTAQFDAVIIGAGFSGLYQLHRLRLLGMSAKIIEAGSDVGGTWYWNRYPGARCDVESMQYSYAFSEELQQEWQWPELFSAQPDILKYANHVAGKLDLRRDILFDTRVTETRFDETTNRWSIRTDAGDRFEAGFLIMATGCLSTARVPDFKGRDSFKGKTYHTGAWPHEGVDFTGQRVGVIGTGSSAIQAIPMIAAQAADLTVFQRTPNFSIPSRNGPMTESYARQWKDEYAALRAEARDTRNGIIAYPNDFSALSVSPEERRRIYEAVSYTHLDVYKRQHLSHTTHHRRGAEDRNQPLRRIDAVLQRDDGGRGTDDGADVFAGTLHVPELDAKQHDIGMTDRGGVVGRLGWHEMRIASRADHAQPLASHRVQMRAACQEPHVRACLGQRRAKRSADATGANDRDFHANPSSFRLPDLQ